MVQTRVVESYIVRIPCIKSLPNKGLQVSVSRCDNNGVAVQVGNHACAEVPMWKKTRT